jgi:hypothetical protein
MAAAAEVAPAMAATVVPATVSASAAFMATVVSTAILAIGHIEAGEIAGIVVAPAEPTGSARHRARPQPQNPDNDNHDQDGNHWSSPFHSPVIAEANCAR